MADKFKSGPYFASRDPKETADILLNKDSQFYRSIYSTGYLDKIHKLYAAYHGLTYYDVSNGHEVTFEGESGELTNISVNHLRNIGNHMLNLVTASRPVLEARAINTDYKSRVQTKLANGLLDYYMREKRLEARLRDAVEYAIVLGSGYIRMEWNATAGEQIDFDDEFQTPIYEGDVEFSLVSPLDLTFDNTKEAWDQMDWVLIRSYKNKYDLMAKYPEYADEIELLPTKSSLEQFSNYIFGINETNDVPVYEFYHRRTESIPDGRYLLFLSKDIILADVPLPYHTIPLFRIAPSDILGTPYGYTPLFDLMAMQDVTNMLYSTITTNQQAFGVQNIAIPRGADISFEALSGGLNIIEYNPQQGKPEAINFTSTPKEVFEFLNIMVQSMETISGINSVVRGNPEANLRSGSALALVQSNSIQFMSNLAQQYNRLIEDVGTGLVKVLQTYASTKRVAAIVGINNRSYLTEFSKDDLSNINRVVVSAGNPLAKTTAGRVQMAQELLQYQLLKDPREYFSIIETGNLDTATEDPQKEIDLIVSENEKLLRGEVPPVLDLDQHSQHILKHKSVFADVRMRENPDLVRAVNAHISMHLDSLRNADPALLSLVGETSLGMPPMQQQMPEGAPEELPNMAEQELPQPASMPKSPTGAPITGQELQQNLRNQ